MSKILTYEMSLCRDTSWRRFSIIVDAEPPPTAAFSADPKGRLRLELRSISQLPFTAILKPKRPSRSFSSRMDEDGVAVPGGGQRAPGDLEFP